MNLAASQGAGANWAKHRTPIITRATNRCRKMIALQRITAVGADRRTLNSIPKPEAPLHKEAHDNSRTRHGRTPATRRHAAANFPRRLTEVEAAAVRRLRPGERPPDGAGEVPCPEDVVEVVAEVVKVISTPVTLQRHPVVNGETNRTKSLLPGIRRTTMAVMTTSRDVVISPVEGSIRGKDAGNQTDLQGSRTRRKRLSFLQKSTTRSSQLATVTLDPRSPWRAQ